MLTYAALLAIFKYFSLYSKCPVLFQQQRAMYAVRSVGSASYACSQKCGLRGAGCPHQAMLVLLLCLGCSEFCEQRKAESESRLICQYVFA